MSKRFTDSNKLDDPFFLEMPSKFKLTFLYMLDKCDQVGVWKVNKKMVEFCLNFPVDWDGFIDYMGDKIHVISSEKWWIRKFCEFQYGPLSEESRSKTTIFYISLLKKHSLWIGYREAIHSPKEKEKEKEKDKRKDKDSEIEISTFEKFWEIYDKKVDREKSLSKWTKLKNLDREKILKVLQKYIQANPERKFRKNPLTFLNGKCWNDEIVTENDTPTDQAPKYRKWGADGK